MVNHPNRNKASRFYEGQEVEVGPEWRKARVVARHWLGTPSGEHGEYTVKFPDGHLAAFDAENIRPLFTDAEVAAYIKKLGEQDKADGIE